jgi:NADH:ubiquinone oxidoreductase subunit 2 (subunit N)
MVFSSASGQYLWLVIIALINSGIGIYYYLKLITVIATKPDSAQPKIVVSPLTVLVVSIATIGTLGLAFLVHYLNFAVVG